VRELSKRKGGVVREWGGGLWGGGYGSIIREGEGASTVVEGRSGIRDETMNDSCTYKYIIIIQGFANNNKVGGNAESLLRVQIR
jgi:hypothetical protein